MTNVSSSRTCACCGSGNAVLQFRGNIDGKVTDRFSQYAWYDDIYRCADCGLVFQDQKLAGQEIGDLIRAEKYLDEQIGLLNIAEKHLQFDQLIGIMRQYTSLEGKSVLDAGANTGVFLDRIRSSCGAVSGVEPSNEAAENARAHYGLNVQSALISEAVLAPNSVDVITMWDVIEHLYDPVQDLRALHAALRPEGYIFISTHDIESRFARWCGRHYLMLMYQHFFHFSPKTLGRMMRDAGYEIEGVAYFRKSWSLAYIANLPEKKWPGSVFSRTVQWIADRVLVSEKARRARIVMPLREFFVIVGRKPAVTS